MTKEIKFPNCGHNKFTAHVEFSHGEWLRLTCTKCGQDQMYNGG